MKDSGVKGSSLTVFMRALVFVAFRIDFEGLHSLDGGNVFRSGFEFNGVLENDGGLMYLVHGEKLTRFDCRVDV